MNGAASVREARARGEADAAKARLMGTVEELKARLAPAKLTSNAVQAAKDRSIVVADGAVNKAKEQPAMVAGAAAATALVIARKPLFSAFKRWRKNRKDKKLQQQSDRQQAVNGEGI